MFHLCKATDPTVKYSSDNLANLFDPRLTCDLIETDHKTSRQFINWIKATVTEDNWQEYFAYRLYGHIHGSIEYIKTRHEYQLITQLLQDVPKWLIEFISLSIDFDGTVRLYYNWPRTDTTWGFARDVIHLRYEGFNVDAEDYLTTPDVHFNDAALVNAKAVLTDVQNKVDAYLNSTNADNLTHCDDHRGNSSFFSPLLRKLYGYLNNYKVLTQRSVAGNLQTIRPLDLAIRISQLADDVRNRISFSIPLESDELYVIYREPLTAQSRQALSQIYSYGTNVLDMIPVTIRGTQEQKAPLYGIELEAASDYRPEQIIAAQSELFFIMKQDSSISGTGRYKYEMVTVPATYRAHKRLWAEFFNKIDYTQFDTSRSTGNGMHVHIDRTAFSQKGHLNRFTWFIVNPANIDFLYEISERPNRNDLTRWAPFPIFPSNTKKTDIMKDAVRANRGIRGAVHFKGSKTVEIRLFKGVVSYATIVKNLEFVDSLFHFTQQASITNVTLTSYLKWLNSQPRNRYAMLREFINKFKSLEAVLLSNEIKDLLFSETNPVKIVDKLNSNKIRVTNKHLTILNRERRKRTFILEKDGKVALAYTNGGKLASLDKELQARMTRGSSSFTVSTI